MPARRRNGPARTDVLDEVDHRGDLGDGKRSVPKLMARIDDLHANGNTVYVCFAPPETAAGVPGPASLGRKGEDPSILFDQIVGRNLGFGIT